MPISAREASDFFERSGGGDGGATRLQPGVRTTGVQTRTDLDAVPRLAPFPDPLQPAGERPPARPFPSPNPLSGEKSGPLTYF